MRITRRGSKLESHPDPMSSLKIEDFPWGFEEAEDVKPSLSTSKSHLEGAITATSLLSLVHAYLLALPGIQFY